MNITFGTTGSSKSIDSNDYCPELTESLTALGLTKSIATQVDYLISINHNRTSYKKFIKNGGNSQKSILIRLEPFAVYPAQYHPKIEAKYGLVLTPGQFNSQIDISQFLGWPYKFHLNPAKPSPNDQKIMDLLPGILNSEVFEIGNWIKRENKMVMIAGNKVSPTIKSNYRLRRKIASSMNISNLNLFGSMWNLPFHKKLFHRLSVGVFSLRTGFFPNIYALYGNFFTRYPTYRGEVLNKHSKLKEYRFSLVIENDSNYISEKLIDCMINGTIPIYIGPKLLDYYLPEDLYIWCDGSLDTLNCIVDSISEERATSMLRGMKDFLGSEKFKKYWLAENVYESISKRIFEFWNL